MPVSIPRLFPDHRLPHHCATPPRHKKPRAQWLACLSVPSYLYGRCRVLPLFHRQPPADPGTICSVSINDAFLYQNSPFRLFSPRLFVSSGFDLSSRNARETTLHAAVVATFAGVPSSWSTCVAVCSTAASNCSAVQWSRIRHRCLQARHG